jgi:N-acetylneuraminate synthase
VPTFASTERVFVIGEAGSNWRMGTPARDLRMARTLIDVAAEAGCDAVKFQTYRAETVYAPNAGRSDYLTASGNSEDIHAIFRDLAMPYEMVGELAAHAKSRALLFMSSPFSVADLAAVDPHVAVHKIASYELNHRRLLEAAARTHKPIIVSTGAAELPEIGAAIALLQREGAGPICLMQCTAAYPADIGALALRVIPALAARFGTAVGLSDHSIEPLTGPTGAVALGARCIEKHYTLQKRLPGPDHAFALEPPELAQMVAAVRAMERALGGGDKTVQPIERELRSYAVRGLQALRDVRCGEALIEGVNFDILRPGRNRQGVSPMRIDELAGRQATRDIPAGDGILEGDWS